MLIGNEDDQMQLPLFEPTVPARSRKPQPALPPTIRSVPAGKHSNVRNPWLTPRNLIDRAVNVLGAIDLDPCSTVEPATNIPARRRITPDEDSLKVAWT